MTMITDKTQIKIINYTNTTIAKFDNRRCVVEDLPNEDVGLIFKSFDVIDTDKPRAIHTNVRNKIAVTRIKISEEAAYALFEVLRIRFQTKQYHKSKP